MLRLLFFPLVDFKSVQAPEATTRLLPPDTLYAGALLAIVFLVLWLWNRAARHPAVPVEPKAWILVDGSNVMYWQDNAPKLTPVLQVIGALQAQGYAPGVVFDANAGWKLAGKYLHHGDLARLLALPVEQVLVVPKGEQADPYLLETAREFSARIVTNDRYRDWAEAHPQVSEPGFLIQGGMRDGRVWLKGVESAKAKAG
ncbi:NYN domain-containing protein [Tabrizicola sp.]|uniref:NYN domain-containing protein n=1 Tax=Tabrizicola sp. TaxID=2005166 RepID=UPI003F317BDB